jgi:outer membrane protein assembly factor BamA
MRQRSAISSFSSPALAVLFAFIGAAQIAVLALSVRAQAAATGSAKLESVTISGSKRFKSDQIAAAIGMKPGTTVDREAIQGSADKLVALGVFATVTYKFSSSPAGVRVIYEVTDGPLVPVVFDNFPWATDADISAALREAGVLFDGTAPLNGTANDQIAQAIATFLDSRSIHVRVSHAPANDSATSQQVQQFRAEDVTLVIDSVTFSDDLAAKDSAIQDRIPDLIGKPYSRSLIDLFVFEQVRPVYLGQAYLRVQFPPPAPKLAAGSANPLSAKIDVTIPILPGARYTWSGIEWLGNSGVKTDELNQLIDLKPGDPVDAIRMAKISERVESLYHERGYLDFKLDAKPKFDDQAAHASFAATISEGPQYRMGKLVLTGLSTEGERRIRKAWAIAPDAAFDESVYQDFLDHGIKQAFSGLPVHYERIGHFLQEDPQSAKVDVLLDFQ